MHYLTSNNIEGKHGTEGKNITPLADEPEQE